MEENLLNETASCIENNKIAVIEGSKEQYINQIESLIDNKKLYSLPSSFLLDIYQNIDFSKLDDGFNKLISFLMNVSKNYKDSIISNFAYFTKISNFDNISTEHLCKLYACFPNSDIATISSTKILELTEENKKLKELLKGCMEQEENKDEHTQEEHVLINDIHKAAKIGDLISIKYLIEKEGIDSSETDINKNTPLHIASFQGHFNVVSYLVEIGAKINLPNIEGNTPLHNACSENCLTIVQYLCLYGADKEAKNRDGNSPLHVAIENGCIDTVKHLVNCEHVDYESENNEGKRPIHTACKEG